MVFRGARRLYFWFRHQRRGVRALGPVLILGGIVLAGVGTLSMTAHAKQAGGDESLAMFGEMMPVFTSPRCSNCHGGVDPVSGANHEPGPVPDSTRSSNGDMGFDEQKVCQECHTAGTPQWRTAPSSMGFVSKDTLTLCRQMRGNFGLSNAANDPDAGAAFVNHLATDDLIGVGFVGQGGIGDDSPFAPIDAAPPPMSRAEMIDAAKRWVGPGQAKCGANGWNGTITSTTTAQNRQNPQPGTLLIKDSATELVVTLAVVESTATANVSFTQHDFTDAQTNRPCFSIHYSWKADGRGDAELNIIGDTDEGGMFLAWSVPEYSGTAHTEMRTVPPACALVQRDEPYVVRKGNGGVQPTVDLNDPNHVVGQKVIEDPNTGSTTTIKWNLSREP
jgi:hypothetical protein